MKVVFYLLTIALLVSKRDTKNVDAGHTEKPPCRA